jgi:3-hydroxymyristoyl/3-hydroxydecanoyl-(acyl carrier protein) dehydratase
MENSTLAPRYPTIVSRESGANSLTFMLNLPENLHWFDGHFPGNPILPAVVQVDWAVYFGNDLGCDARKFTGMPRLKFMVVITPGTELKLVLVWKNNQLKFTYTSSEGMHSEGMLEFSR